MMIMWAQSEPQPDLVPPPQMGGHLAGPSGCGFCNDFLLDPSSLGVDTPALNADRNRTLTPSKRADWCQ